LRGKGLPGSLNFRGTYASKSVYNHHDVVTSDSSSFVATKDNPGPCPGDGWQMLACGGKRGAPGERGPAGPAAAPMRFVESGLDFRDGMITLEVRLSDGSTSRLPLFKNIVADASDFTLRFEGTNGSALRVNLAPLFERFQSETRR
jgi:hypothetical protein